MLKPMPKLLRFLRGQSLSRRITVQAFILILWMRIGLYLNTSQTIRRALKTPTKEPKITLVGLYAGFRPTAQDLGDAIRLVSRFIPKASCLTQALAGKRLLASYGYPSELKLGVTKPTEFKAHAWLEHKSKIVLGQVKNLADYTVFERGRLN